MSEVMGVRWVPAATAARILKVSRQRIYQLVHTEQLVGQLVDGHVLILLESVHRREKELGQLDFAMEV
jgi:hypothetical protein